jgi:hypothetical protein
MRGAPSLAELAAVQRILATAQQVSRAIFQRFRRIED